jgi:hypothetical protein
LRLRRRRLKRSAYIKKPKKRNGKKKNVRD